MVHERDRALGTRNGRVATASEDESLGVGMRVMADGGWGFAATQELTREGVERCAALAVEIARGFGEGEGASRCNWCPSRRRRRSGVRLARSTRSRVRGGELRVAAAALTRPWRRGGVTLAETNLNFRRYEQWFYNTEGAAIHQTRITTGAGYAAYAFEGTRSRSAPIRIRFGGQWQSKGYELIDELRLLENAERVGEECVALQKAPQCPEGRRDLVLDSSQMGLQIHESIGHPIELDRVLGMEANFAGTSFLTLDKLNTCAMAATW